MEIDLDFPRSLRGEVKQVRLKRPVRECEPGFECRSNDGIKSSSNSFTAFQLDGSKVEECLKLFSGLQMKRRRNEANLTAKGVQF